MSYELSALDLHYLLEELSVVVGARVDKLYNPEKKELLIQLFLTGMGKKILRIRAPGFIYLTDFKGEQKERPSGFCTLLRKYLDGSRISSIRLLGFERIIEIAFEGKEGKFRLVFELFSKGNIIFCRDDLTIIQPVESQEWKDRTIRPKLGYTYPKKPLNFLEVDEKSIGMLMEKSGKSLVKLLAIELGLGGVYAEELCALSQIPKESTRLTEPELKRLILASRELVSRKLDPAIVFEVEKLKAIVPFGLSTLSELRTKEFKSYNEALDYAFTNELVKSSDEKKLSKNQEKIERIMRIIARQDEYLKELEVEIVEDTKIGEAVYQNYSLLGSVLKELAKAREKYSFREIKERLKGHKLIKEIKEKEKSAIVEIE
jgi:predicted ribosome quality control (RQC) complex YloA/Tae2 family protein